MTLFHKGGFSPQADNLWTEARGHLNKFASFVLMNIKNAYYQTNYWLELAIFHQKRKHRPHSPKKPGHTH